jgi:hypothetical protein
MHNKIPHHIQVLFAEKRKASANWQKSKYSNDKIKFNQLNNKLKKVIRKHKNMAYNSYNKALTTTNCSLWKATKFLLRLKQASPPVRKTDQSWAIIDLEKFNILAKHLSKCFTLHNIKPSFPNYKFWIVDSNHPSPCHFPLKPPPPVKSSI